MSTRECPEEHGQGQGDAIASEESHGLRWLLSTPWAILPHYLSVMADIASRAPARLPDVAADWQALQTKRRDHLGGTFDTTIRDGVAVVPIAGPLFRRANLFTAMSGATSTEVLARDINQAIEDPAVDAIVLAIDSPGGQVSGIAELAEHIRRGTEIKPIVAHIAHEGASAAYWLASAASEVTVSSTALVGGIGAVLTLRRGGEGQIEIVSTQSPRKRLDPASESGRAALQSTVDDLAAVMIEDIARHRGTDVDTVLADFGQGDVLVGGKAVSAGLADRTSTLEDVIAGLTGSNQESLAMSARDLRPDITADTIRDNHPAVAAEIRADVIAERDRLQAELESLRSGNETALAEARRAAATAERERIRGVLDQGLPGHEALVERLAFDGSTSPEQAAVAVLKAERDAGSEALARRRETSVPPVPPQHSETGIDAGAGPLNLDDEDGLRKRWSASPQLRQEFLAFEDWVAYHRAKAEGRVRELHSRAS